MVSPPSNCSSSHVTKCKSSKSLSPSPKIKRTFVVTEVVNVVFSVNLIIITTNGVLMIVAPPVITQSPVSQSVLAGQNSSFSVTANGSDLGYQWFFNSNGISGATTSLLGLTKVSTTNAGPYIVIVTNSAGAATSSVATLSVAATPTVTVSFITSGQLQLNASSITGLTYVVQSASNLMNPMWLPVLTNNTGIGGSVTFQTNTGNGSGVFYRLMFP